MKKLILIIPLFVLGCSNKKNDQSPQAAAREYCDCMKRNGASKDYLYALTVCDGELVQKYRLYRLKRIDIRYYKTNRKLSVKTIDSIGAFSNAMDAYTHEHCCDMALNCAYDTLKK